MVSGLQTREKCVRRRWRERDRRRNFVTLSYVGLKLRRYRVCCYKEMRWLSYREMLWLGMYNHAETRAGNHQRHTQQTPANQHWPTTLHEIFKRQSPNKASVQASNQHTTLTSYRPLCHPGTRHRHRGTTPTEGATGTRVAHIQLETKAPGQPPGTREEAQTRQRRRAGP